MSIIELLEHPDIVRIVSLQKEVNRQKALAGYNLFTISSYSAHLENFHSDIIASLLNPEGLHGEGYKFLHLFIDYLVQCHQITINKNHFANTIVLRETGRLDIWIKDKESRQSVIIENKINDATDRDDQLKDYYEYATRNGYSVNAILYLSKDGSKLAPDNGKAVQSLTTNIAAFNNTFSDLYNGWLKPSLAQSHNEDSRSFIHQYSKLIAHMGNINMDTEVKELFYQFINKNNGIELINIINTLTIHLPDYRAKCFADKTEDFQKRSPFRNRFKYYNNYYIFERYERKDGSYKLDVCFEPNGGAFVVIWNTKKENASGYETVKSLLTTAGLVEKFNKAPSRYNGMAVEFAISKEHPSLKAVDNAVLTLVNDVFEKLSIVSKQTE